MFLRLKNLMNKLHVYPNNNLSNVQTDLNKKVSFYGAIQSNQTLQDIVDLSRQNSKFYIGYIDWQLGDLLPAKNTMFFFASNWLVIGVSNAGMYTLDGSTLSWKKI